ncbi:hypothetical protein KUTeg_023680 [Tegillarca granosa]|uniref:Uncharacterized protein n=1 Tax=Tegillarca granosa TaxID=220873 RepID=A0ABQ9E7Z5_TEGGR|nr:hypothetical protein KUTeg_023680 [Tegillarca granosa]
MAEVWICNQIPGEHKLPYTYISFFMRKRIIAIYAYATNDTYQKERLCVIRISQLLTRLNANIPAATAPNKTHCTVCSQEKEMILTNYTSREVVNLHLNTHVLIQFFNWRLVKSVKNIFLEVFWIVSLVCIKKCWVKSDAEVENTFSNLNGTC